MPLSWALCLLVIAIIIPLQFLGKGSQRLASVGYRVLFVRCEFCHAALHRIGLEHWVIAEAAVTLRAVHYLALALAACAQHRAVRHRAAYAAHEARAAVLLIARKFKRAVTDSDTEHCVHYDLQNKPGVSNLMSIYSSVTGKTFDEIEREFDGQGYGAFKPAVGEAVIEALRPIREEAERMIADKAYLKDVYTEGARRASYVASKTLRKVYKRVGLVEKPF